MTLPTRLFSPSLPIIIPAILLLAIGLLSIWTAAAVDIPTDAGMQAAARTMLKSYFGKQCIAAALGGAMAIALSCLRPTRLRAAGYSLYASCLAVLVVLFVLGRVRNGARSWFVIGPFSVQPSEFMKLFFVLALARYLMWRRTPDRITRLVAPCLLAGVPFALILLQPDLGTALIFPAMFGAMLWVAGMKKRHLFAGIAVAMIATPVAYHFGFKEYQKKRFQAFLDPKSMAKDAGFQLLQSQKAIGSGGFAGRGWGESEQEGPESFIPERHNDFIFAVIGEEWGLVGATAVLGLYFILLMAMVLGAYRSREPFGRLVLTGLAAGFATQVFVNVGMTIGVAPITGITLPFLSYGGSSLLASLLSIGVAWNISSQGVLTLAGKDFQEGTSEVLDLGTEQWRRSA